ncbi:unnamed protein product, partial [Prorocentrum cordatum]
WARSRAAAERSHAGACSTAPEGRSAGKHLGVSAPREADARRHRRRAPEVLEARGGGGAAAAAAGTLPPTGVSWPAGEAHWFRANSCAPIV